MDIQSLLLPTHKISVMLFLALYLLKTILLLANSESALNTVKRFTKVPEMIISTLFLVTGVWMFIEIGDITILQIVKLVLVFASIPLAVIAFKRGKKPLAIASIICLVAAYGLAEMNAAKKRKAAGNATTTGTTEIVTDPAATGYNSLEHGKYVYNNIAPVNCKSCHGENGNAMIGGASDLTVSGLDKDGIKAVIKEGRNGGKMPAFSSLEPAEYEALADYIISLRK